MRNVKFVQRLKINRGVQAGSGKTPNGKTLVISLGIICIILGASLAFMVVNYVSLQNRISYLNELVDSMTESFFVQDPNFTTSLSKNPFWKVEAWHNQSDSISEIMNETLRLFYNGTNATSYGNSGVFQGRHTYGGFTHQLLVGNSSENAYRSDCVVFPKDMPSDTFWLETNFTIARLGFNVYPTVFDTAHARVNLGVTLMCAINDQPLNLTGQNLWLDVYFAGYSLDETDIVSIQKDANYVNETGDIHAGYFVGEVSPENFGNCTSMRVDLGDYVTRTLDLITKTQVKTIRVYGIILFVECLRAYAEVEYDYLRTTRT